MFESQVDGSYGMNHTLEMIFGGAENVMTKVAK